MKKTVSLLLALCLCLSLCACSKQEAPASPTQSEAAPEQTPEAEIANMVNPMTEATPASLLEELGFDMSFMEKYESVKFFRYNTDPVIAEAQFVYDNLEYSYRIAAPAQETDISGMYYTDCETADASVSYNSARVRTSSIGGDISWYDIVPGIQYCLICTDSATAEALTALANELYVPMQGEAGGENDGFLQDALLALQSGYHPGTAGSSLTGAAHAASLADLFTEVQPDAETVGQEIYRFGSGLSAKDQEAFAAQLLGVQGCFANLAQNGIAILEDAGATAAHYPWDSATISTLFAAMTLYGSEYAYSVLLEDYAAAIKEGKSWEELREAGMNYMVHDLTLDTVGYAFEDLDNNGVKELILGAIADDDYLHGLVLELDTMDAFGFRTAVFMSGERDRLYTMGGDKFIHEGSSGAADSFEAVEQYANGELTQIGSEADKVESMFLLPLSYLP